MLNKNLEKKYFSIINWIIFLNLKILLKKLKILNN